MLRTVIRGKRSDIGLGGLSIVGLADAREKAARLRRSAREGGDPLEDKRRAQRTIPTFEEAALRVHQQQLGSWRNDKHAAQWINTLRTYAFPELGSKRVDLISTADVLRVLGPIWLLKPETAKRVRQRLGAVLDWSKAAGFREGENPVDGVHRGLPKQSARPVHHAALAYDEAPQFVRRLRGTEAAENVRLAFEFLILTAARTGEVIQARWDEFDLDKAVWTVPAERMKARREHRVPLSGRAIELLARARELAGPSLLVFPGRSPVRPLSNMAFLMALRRMEASVTAHGFRSAFRDWAAERTNFPREVCEGALAHVVGNKVEAAYRRSDLFEKRRQLMEAWSAFLCQAGGEVVPLRA
jgi:integrase